MKEGRRPDPSWSRCRGRHRRTWVDQVRDDAGILLSTLWTTEIARGHGARRDGLRPGDNDDADYLKLKDKELARDLEYGGQKQLLLDIVALILTSVSTTRRPASADRTARAANFRRDLEAM